MGKLARLKRFAQTQLAKLQLECPVYDWSNPDNPIHINVIYPQKEWTIESPAKELSKRQDWTHWFACDALTKQSVEIFFERLQEHVAVVWVKLQINERLLLLRESLYRDNSAGCVYSAGGIHLECSAPMRLWRLAINTNMEDTSRDPGERNVHVRLGARVAALGHTFELPKECPASFLADRFLNEESVQKAEDEIVRSCAECQAIFQPYTLYTEVFLNGQRQEMVLFGSRLKFIGSSALLHKVRLFIGYSENGTVFSASKSTSANVHGYMFDPSRFIQRICGGHFESDNENEPLENSVKIISIKSEKKMRTFTLESVKPISIRALNRSTGPAWELQGIEGQLFESKSVFKWMGTSFVRPVGYNILQGKVDEAKLLEYPNKVTERTVLSTLDAECKNPNLTGGKSSSLAALSSISRHLKSFSVPAAVVLTVNSYNNFAAIPEVDQTIKNFLLQVNGADLKTLKLASRKCVAKISDVELPQKFQTELAVKMREIFGNHWERKRFAVRSSAVGEDSEETSAAGQMTTYLGMKGNNEISLAVVKCWASQFAFTAVSYKRQYGQELSSPMAVIVQEMVSAESAGVMFTCDPVSSDPSSVFISANFGLGESVVSSAADPDTYTFRRDGQELTLLSKTCGRKECMITESETGTEVKSIGATIAQSYCLTDDFARTIATIGASLCDIMDSPCDIEWAIKDDVVYLLQSRPIKSFLRETDFEIRHDLDSAFYTSREIFTRANIDEVMPGALSPLSVYTTCHILFGMFARRDFSKTGLFNANTSQYTTAQSFCCGKKNFTNISQNGLAKKKKFIETSKLATMGYDFSNHKALEEGVVHESVNTMTFKALKFLCKTLKNAKKEVAYCQKYADEVRIDLPENGNSLDLLTSAIQHLPKLYHCFVPLLICSMLSIFYNFMTLNLLKKSQNEEENTPEIMSLFSKLLRSEYEVESALIPKRLAELSTILREDLHFKGFADMDPEAALSWLETDAGQAGIKFRNIRTENAHRCYKEFDLLSETWDLNPMPLIHTLQANVRCGSKVVQEEEVSITVDQLPKRPSFLRRKLLNFSISKTQYFVFAREATKSALMKCFHKLRLSMRRIGTQLYAEGRIPDPELVFFFTCDEMYRLILTRDPSLLPRAIRRHKMHPLLDKERFPVLFCGLPKPLDSTPIQVDPEARSMTGLPVSQGVVIGPARVVYDFHTEAHLIQKGDILVTRATDTGWTPYFPLLGGIVTEMGGVLSHGAVVAREYGLPAVVGVCGVTDFLESGEIVTLDGNQGTVSKSEESGSTKPHMNQ